MRTHDVLVVEDSASDVDLLRDALRATAEVGVVHVARRLADGLELLATTPGIAVTFLDLGLPDAQGLDTLRRFVEAAPDVAVVVTTGSSEEVLGHQAVAAGAQDFVSKWSFDEVDLGRVLRYAADRHRISHDLRVANAELRAFAHVVAHDLRSPVATALGYLDLVKRIDDPQQVAEVSELLRRSLIRMSDLVTDVLRWSTAAEREPAWDEVDLDELARSAAAGHPDGHVVVAPDLPRVRSDAVLLGQVVDNLVANAVHYGQRAHLSAERVDGVVRLRVDDEGTGVDPGEQETIFEPFRRGARSAGTVGTGMGLSIVQRAVARLDGTVRVRSAPGGGARFEVELPLDAGAGG